MDAQDRPLDRAVAALKGLCRREEWRKRLKVADRHRLVVSFWGCIGFIGLGSSVVVFGPTLLDVASHLSVGVGSLAFMFAVRALGAAIGSVGSGFILDRLERFSYTILVGILLAAIASTSAVPLSVHIVMLGCIMFFNGVATGSLDNGTHIVLLRMWKENAGPCMQVAHFAFALGAFFAPLLAKPFISDEADDDDDDDDTSSNSSVFSCSEIINELFSIFGNVTLSVNDNQLHNFSCTDLLSFTSQCANTTNYSSTIQVGELLAANNCSNGTDTTSDSGSSLFGWAYWISASFFIPPVIAFVYYSVRLDMRKLLKKFKPAASGPTATSTSEEAEDPDRELKDPNSPTKSQENESRTPAVRKQSRCHRVIILTLLFLFMFTYVGLEVAFGSFIFTVAVKGELQFSKQSAAVLASVFWGTFAFARVVSVFLVFVKTPASWMMTGNVTGSVIAATIMLAFPHNAIAIWVGSALLGTSYASIYPTTMTWFAEHIEVTGTATAVIVTGGILGDISLPAAVGFLVGHVSYDSLVYFTFVGIFVSAVFLALLFLTAYLEKRRRNSGQNRSTESVRYSRLAEDRSDESTIQVSDGVVNGDSEAEIESGDEAELLDNVQT